MKNKLLRLLAFWIMWQVPIDAKTHWAAPPRSIRRFREVWAFMALYGTLEVIAKKYGLSGPSQAFEEYDRIQLRARAEAALQSCLQDRARRVHEDVQAEELAETRAITAALSSPRSAAPARAQ